jgi:hypothetical protein
VKISVDLQAKVACNYRFMKLTIIFMKTLKELTVQETMSISGGCNGINSSLYPQGPLTFQEIMERELHFDPRLVLMD